MERLLIHLGDNADTRKLGPKSAVHRQVILHGPQNLDPGRIDTSWNLVDFIVETVTGPEIGREPNRLW